MPVAKRTVDKWHKIFAQVNRDCKKSGEQVVPLTDSDYYANQLDNLGVRNADEVAKAIAQREIAVRADLVGRAVRGMSRVLGDRKQAFKVLYGIVRDTAHDPVGKMLGRNK